MPTFIFNFIFGAFNGISTYLLSHVNIFLHSWFWQVQSSVSQHGCHRVGCTSAYYSGLLPPAHMFLDMERAEWSTSSLWELPVFKKKSLVSAFRPVPPNLSTGLHLLIIFVLYINTTWKRSTAPDKACYSQISLVQLTFSHFLKMCDLNM